MSASMGLPGSAAGPSIESPTRRLGPAVRPRPAPRFGPARRALAGLVFAGVFGAHAASAQHTLVTDAANRTAPRTVDDRWRARGVAFVDFPLGFRARYEAQALHRLAPRQDPAAPFLDSPTSATRLGARLLESRFALSRVLAPHLELELAWATRSPISMVDLLRVEDQRLAAMIRFVP